jgi:hypothetical protein
VSSSDRRHEFAGTAAEVVWRPGSGDQVLLYPGARLWVYGPSGARTTDLLDENDAAISELVCDRYGTPPPFFGPLGVTKLWVGLAGQLTGRRTMVLANDLDEDIRELELNGGGGGSWVPGQVAGSTQKSWGFHQTVADLPPDGTPGLADGDYALVRAT